jgi:four helix bundle protein
MNVIKTQDKIEIKKIHYSIIDQVVRSSTSIGANIVEAKSASSRRDFIKYYEIALKSVNETKYWLCILRDGLNIEGILIEPLLKEAD